MEFFLRMSKEPVSSVYTVKRKVKTLFHGKAARQNFFFVDRGIKDRPTDSVLNNLRNTRCDSLETIAYYCNINRLKSDTNSDNKIMLCLFWVFESAKISFMHCLTDLIHRWAHVWAALPHARLLSANNHKFPLKLE